VNNLLEMIKLFGAKDFLDIVLLSMLVYQFLKIIRGTRAVQILFGVTILAIIHWLSLNAELTAINWVFKNIFDYLIIILVILFQDQIKISLASLGRSKYFNKKNKFEHEKIIEEVVLACSALSKEKTGALIVLEKSYGLLNYAFTGTKLNSEVHADILYSLFQSSSPIHDGAIIIIDDKIASAGCLLPLSKNLELEKKFGTRHRAALGISEVTDAVAIIVSEETGKITVCLNGVFYNCDSENELRLKIRRALILEVESEFQKKAYTS